MLIFTKLEIVCVTDARTSSIKCDKMNPVVLELPDDKRTFIIDYCLKGVGWMAQVYFMNRFYILITMSSS